MLELASLSTLKSALEKTVEILVGPLALISAMASSGVVKVILSFYRDDDQGSAFERHRDRVPFYMDNHNFCAYPYNGDSLQTFNRLYGN